MANILHVVHCFITAGKTVAGFAVVLALPQQGQTLFNIFPQIGVAALCFGQGAGILKVAATDIV